MAEENKKEKDVKTPVPPQRIFPNKKPDEKENKKVKKDAEKEEKKS